MSNGKPDNALKLFKVKVSNIIGSVAILLSLHTQLSAQPFKLLSDKNVSDIVRELTIEEKAKILVGGYMESYTGQGAVSGHTMKMVQGAAGTTASLPSHGIFPVVMADGPAGLRIDPIREGDPETYYCTAFPIGTLLASTWDTEAVKLCGEAMGNEVREYGCDVLLGPGMNIQRHPLCGRNFEYYSEDPVLSGKIAAAMVKGLQSQGIGASIKHFAGNNQESLRLQNNAVISQRALREIYLRGFEIAVKEGKPWTVMSSYNRINGPYTQENRDLLTTILRNEWGYDGVVITDWIGQRNTVSQIHAGNDILMPGEKVQSDDIVKGVKNGTLSIDEVDEAVARVLNFILKTPKYSKKALTGKPNSSRNSQISRLTAADGMILLKNDDNTLPISRKSVISLFGVNAYESISGGTGAGYVHKPYMVNLDEGLKNFGMILNPSTDTLYKKYMSWGHSLLEEQNAHGYLGAKTYVPESALTTEYINCRADDSDIAVVSFGRNSGEYNDRSTEDFFLTENEMILLTRVSDVFHSKGKKVVVVLNIGGVIETQSWKGMADAILLTWQGGQEHGNAVASLLCGETVPSGHLPVTFPVSCSSHPSDMNFPKDYVGYHGDWADNSPERSVKNLGYTLYEEDIWVGYRYFNTYAKNEISFPFGHGLSYTSFEWSDVKVSLCRDAYHISLLVKNTGNLPGKDVVQLYITAPDGELLKPSMELKAFCKTGLLQKGESQKVTMELKIRDLASFDEDESAFVVDKGIYRLSLARSSENIVTTIQVKAPYTKNSVNDVLHPDRTLQTLKME